MIGLPSLRALDGAQGTRIWLATEAVWCGDVADLVEPLYELMAERVRASHVVATDDSIMPMLSKGKTTNARMWVCVGDDGYQRRNVFSQSSLRTRVRIYKSPSALVGKVQFRPQVPVFLHTSMRDAETIFMPFPNRESPSEEPLGKHGKGPC